eukprot:gene8483-4471_t
MAARVAEAAAVAVRRALRSAAVANVGHRRRLRPAAAAGARSAATGQAAAWEGG